MINKKKKNEKQDAAALPEARPANITGNSSTRSVEGINDALDAIRTKFGEEAIMKLGEKPRVNVNAIPSGSLGLDWALGIGGMPRGRIVEIFGPESSG